MSKFFRPYEGKRPYVFVSYSHRNSAEVLETISILNDRKLRLWYDEGIPSGDDWSKNIQEHMNACAAVLFFLSQTAIASPNCLNEIRTAVQLKRPLICVRIHGCELTEEWKTLLADCKAIITARAPEKRATEILSAPILKRRFYRKWTDHLRWDYIGLGIAMILLLGAGVSLFALLSGRFDPPPPYVLPTASPTDTPSPTATAQPTPTVDPNIFPVQISNKQIETAVRRALNKPTGDILKTELSGITELYFVGNMTVNDLSAVSFEEDGVLKVYASQVIDGKVDDVTALGSLAFLERLALIRQPVTDLKPLGGLVLLRELRLSGSDQIRIGTLQNLPALETLYLDRSAAKDLTSLEALPSLKTVYVNADMLPLSWSESARFEVQLIQ